ncbi:hypothetical protein RJ640_020200, partial [Escallonia rubra]
PCCPAEAWAADMACTASVDVEIDSPVVVPFTHLDTFVIAAPAPEALAAMLVVEFVCLVLYLLVLLILLQDIEHLDKQRLVVRLVVERANTWIFGRKGPSGFSARSTAEEVTQGIDGTGLTAIVTGASSGIGVETTRVLALHGVFVVMAVRNMDAGRKIKEAIVKEIPNAKIDVMELDLSSMASIRNFALNFNSSDLPLNLLINNAGIMNPPFMLSQDNIELLFATNHLGHFLLTNLLLETMKKTSRESHKEGRVINVASEGHRVVYPEGIRYDKINDELSFKSLGSYGQSKVANILHANELARRLKSKSGNFFSSFPIPSSIRCPYTIYKKEWSPILISGLQHSDAIFSSTPDECAASSIPADSVAGDEIARKGKVEEKGPGSLGFPVDKSRDVVTSIESAEGLGVVDTLDAVLAERRHHSRDDGGCASSHKSIKRGRGGSHGDQQEEKSNFVEATAQGCEEEGVEITANSLHPGVIATNFFCFRRLHTFIEGMINFVGRCVLKNVPQGAATTCYVALHPQIKGATGEYFVDSNIASPSALAKNEESAKKLWEFSLSLTDPK